MKENSKRIDYFDFLRGVAILMVIGIHTYTIRSFDGWDSVVLIGIREVLNFAVTLFLAISGFFIGRKSLSDKNSYFTFLKKQIPRVYIPALIWSLPMLVLWIYKGQGIVLSIGKVLGCMTFGHYYFVVLIIQFYLLHPLIKRMAAKPAVGGDFVGNKYSLCLFASL